MRWCILFVLTAMATAAPLIWLSTLPERTYEIFAVSTEAEQKTILKALRPIKNRRPLIGIVAFNGGTETTDFLLPAGILRRANIADVKLLATDTGSVRLYPALQVIPDATLAEFDKAFPDGADYIIVPAMKATDERLQGWLRHQYNTGAIIISVCAGAMVTARAGLLDGKQATTHWFYVPKMLKRYPSIKYVPDRRIVVDDRNVTTTGITASIPAMLTLIEAIAGREKASNVAATIGVRAWDAGHASANFRLDRSFAIAVLSNATQFWRYEKFALHLQQGVDEVALALSADAWSRTYRSTVIGIGNAPIKTANGIVVLPEHDPTSTSMQNLPQLEVPSAAKALDQILAAIGKRYGSTTAEVVAMQLEYPMHQSVRP